MSKLILNTVGGNLPETIVLDSEAVVSPGAGEVLVEVEAAPINGADQLFAAGWFGVYPELPAALGAEGVGRVVAVGSNGPIDLIGRRVVMLPTFRHGTWATHTVVPAEKVIPVPDHGDPVQLAMLAVNPAAAHALLNDFVQLHPGDWVGLNLANSAVGHYLIALARRAGIKTLAVVRREEAAEEVRQLGADAVVVAGEDLSQRVAQVLDGSRLRVLFEGTGDPEQVAQLVTAVQDGGSVVTFASVTGQAPAIPLPDLIYRGISLRSFYILTWIQNTPRERLEQVYAELAELVVDGTLAAAIEATYALDEYAKALQHAAEDGRSGKVLFTPNL
jgi:NADPH:quinone reductase-like Zn-dependent oxidoreductase